MLFFPLLLFFFTVPASTLNYTFSHTLSLHDALPISAHCHLSRPKTRKRAQKSVLLLDSTRTEYILAPTRLDLLQRGQPIRYPNPTARRRLCMHILERKTL